ncbi:CBU_0592 family membrane protein [Sinomonas mesophila]|uniref:CBU_0592 family membrane protein n=1 Tax=Sinomonas mesophila TaxID=1531955 RepID=UPI000984D797|nr:hypothetical protein [Sinomonas mesophila]
MLAAALGWMGTAGTFVAYVMLSRGRLAAESRMYATLNMVGGLLGGIACVLYGAWPSAAANFAWAGLGLHGMVKAFRRVNPAEAEPSPAPSHTGSGDARLSQA